MGVHSGNKAGWKLSGLRATKEQYDRMVAEGLGERDKSGIAEFPSKIATNIPPIVRDVAACFFFTSAPAKRQSS